MQEDARYAIAIGPAQQNLDGTVAADFLKYFLLPRREVGADSGDAEWAFCLACDTSQLPGRFEILSRGDGIVFGRLR
jgi:hypothetical protein